jgi:cation:H+ antiporter
VNGLLTPLVALAFAAAAIATWVAGIGLSRTTDELDHRLGLGEALGGMVLLAVAGTLPEIAIVVSACAAGNLGLAAGNVIGGIAIQTMVLAICDAAASPSEPLTFLVGSLVPVLEGLAVVVVLAETLLGALLPAGDALGPVSPASIAIVVTWVGLVYVLNRVRRAPAWSLSMPGSRPGRPHRRVRAAHHPAPQARRSTAQVAALFGVGCVVTLVAGVVLESGGSVLADRGGINGVVFGATVLAAASALPEISSGVAAVRLGDHQLAMGDVFGGNSFQVCLFLLADLIAGKAVLPTVGPLNSWLGGLAIALTTVYLVGVIARPTRCRLRLGPDSLIALVLFAIGIFGLTRIS